MSTISLNGYDLMALRLRLHLYGAWVADCTHANPEQTPTAGSPATISLESQTFVGTVVRVSNLGDLSWDTLVVAGHGGLSKLLPVAQFVSPTVGLILQDAVSLCGESLSPTIDPAFLSRPLQSWRRPIRELGRELDAICSELSGDGSIVWRVLPDGTIWLGVNLWVEAVVENYDIMSWGAQDGCVEIGAEDPTVSPGQTFNGVGRIGTVIHQVNAEETRSQMFLVGAYPGDKEAGAFDALLPQIDLLAFYQYQVLSQNADGTLELKSTDTRLPNLSRVPTRFGIPGISAAVSSGGVVLVGFGAGGSDDPYVASWITQTPTSATWSVGSTLELGGSPATSYVALSSLTAGQLSAISASIINIAAAVNVLAPGSVTNIYGITTPIGSVAATKVKAV
jgi:hypothetical protein